MQQNPQYIRTDKAIRQALIKLLKTKSFEKITVQDILDETPVTRSTFYKHYHDKYEIAEKMQEDFFKSQDALQRAFYDHPAVLTSSLMQITQQNQELMDALLKIHTEHVDLRQRFSEQAREYYLSGTTGNYPKLEAEIYAQVITAYRLAIRGEEGFSFEHMHETYVCVLLRLLGLQDDEELKKLLKKKAVAQVAPPMS